MHCCILVLALVLPTHTATDCTDQVTLNDLVALSLLSRPSSLPLSPALYESTIHPTRPDCPPDPFMKVRNTNVLIRYALTSCSVVLAPPPP